MIFNYIDKQPEEIEVRINELVNILHKEGPIDQSVLSELAILKYYHLDFFSKFEPELMYLLGLFYKTSLPDSLVAFSYKIFRDYIFEDTKQKFTPIQYALYKDIKENKIYSFSAPTSAGKSFLLRKLISECKNDVVIVVPSRALVAEYIYVLRETFVDDKAILILPFIEDINILRTKRRVFVLTPERLSEIYKDEFVFNVDMFLFDEAQLADDKQRGINFINIVNKANKKFPNAKKIFAHPFINNPEVQLQKLGLKGKSKTFPQNTVGKIFIEKKEEGFYLFNPFNKGGYLKKNKITFDHDIILELLEQKRTVLFFVSKKDITEKRILSAFNQYIQLCENISNPEANIIIDRIEELIDAKDERNSMLVNLLRKGIVIHHGSIPLDVRFLLERFTTKGYARICFSTSTLLQGINMPFDAIYIDNFRFYGDLDSKNLGLKNLIGRAGRTTQIINHFDYGFVIVNNSKKFSERICGESKLSEKSVINQDIQEDDLFLKESIDGVKNNQIDNETNEPESRLNRFKQNHTKELLKQLLDILFIDLEKMRDYGSFSPSEKDIVKSIFIELYEVYIGRKMKAGEKYIFSSGLTILLWEFQGNSFKKILNLRYNYLAHGNIIRKINQEYISGVISKNERDMRLSQNKLDFSPIPSHLPDINKEKCPPSYFVGKSLLDFDYDTLVYDTYDYVDKVVELSLKEPFITAFMVYFDLTSDTRAKQMILYLRYGTIDEKIILLKKYGFSEEQIEDILDMIISISENEIVFDQSKIDSIDDPILKDLINRYI